MVPAIFDLKGNTNFTPNHNVATKDYANHSQIEASDTVITGNAAHAFLLTAYENDGAKGNIADNPFTFRRTATTADYQNLAIMGISVANTDPRYDIASASSGQAFHLELPSSLGQAAAKNLTGAGAGGGPHVKVWDYDTLNLVAEKMAYDKYTFPSGLVVDMLFGGGPHVKVHAGRNLDLIRNFFSGEMSDSRGVFVGR
ncbi:MAG: hypothetical protein ACK5E4_11990 [Planctomycetia bacterium]